MPRNREDDSPFKNECRTREQAPVCKTREPDASHKTTTNQKKYWKLQLA